MLSMTIFAALAMAPDLSTGQDASVPASPNHEAAQGIPMLAEGEGRDVATKLAALLVRQYSIPEFGERYAEALRRNAASGRYDHGNWKELCDRLTADLQAIHPDGHLRVNAGPVPGPDDRAKGAKPLVPVEAGQWAAPGVAYLRINRFTGKADNAEAIRSFLLGHQDARALILDLRDHRGGRFDEMDAMLPLLFAAPTAVVDMAIARDVEQEMGPLVRSASLSVIPGPASLIVRRHAVTPDPNHQGLAKIPLYVLTSRHTASAGEHLSLALKHRPNTVLIGEHTAGANHFGGIEAITDHFNVWMPSGRSTDPETGKDWEGTGIAPDVAVAPADALADALARAGLAPDRAKVRADEIEATLAASVD